jgi:hypothetical protein
MTHRLGLLSAGAVALAGASAYGSGGMITEAYSFSFVGAANITTPFTGPIRADTALFNGDRLDLPAGPGVDTIVPDLFTAFCVEVGVPLQNFGVHKVVPLLGSTTDPTGGPGPAVLFDPLRTARVERLWGGFLGAVVDTNTAAAFQLALWEITYDTDMSLIAPGSFLVGAGQFQLGISDVAQTWLSIVDSAAPLPQPTLYLLVAPGNQDIITTPAPGAAMLFGMGGFLAMRRRR